MSFRSVVFVYDLEVLQSNKLLGLRRELLDLRRELPQKGVQEPKDPGLVENGGSAT